MWKLKSSGRFEAIQITKRHFFLLKQPPWYMHENANLQEGDASWEVLSRRISVYL